MFQSTNALPGTEEARRYLLPRIGWRHFEKRIFLEQRREYIHRSKKMSPRARLNSSRPFARWCFGAVGLYRRGRRNALNIVVAQNLVTIENLPNAFDGFKILHLSDMHLECMAELADTLAAVIKPLHPDVTVITGDIRFRSFGNYERSLTAMRKVRDAIDSECYAVLGNHDSIRMVPGLEAMGIRVLLNESQSLQKNHQSMFLVGVDDTSDYDCDDISLATRDVVPESVSILLAHSPERLPEAARAGIDLYLCGHTHGGQICLPGGLPIRRNTTEDWKYCSGAWQWGSQQENMHGYTSRGVGTTLIENRFNCLPEVIVHTLNCVG